MRRSVASWAVRIVAIVALTAAVGLWALARPVVAPTSTAGWEPLPTAPASPTAVLPSPPAETASPTRTRTTTPTPPASPLATPTATQTATPSPVPTVPLTGTAAALASATSTLQAPPTPAGSQLLGRMELQSYPSQVAGGTQTYSIYLPPQYDQTDRRYPVLYLLHGWPYRDANWDKIGAGELVDRMIADGSLPPFIIVMPWATESLFVGTSGGSNSFEAQLIQDLIPHVDATYRTWAQREGRALGGISRGGVWSLQTGFYHADSFAAVGAHSPALELNRAPAMYDPFYLLDRPGVNTLRIYLDAGDADWARKDTAALHEAMDAAGLMHIFVVHPGGHANALWMASLGEYLAFYSYGWPMDGFAP